MSGEMSLAAYVTNLPFSRGPACRQTCRVRFIASSFVATLGKLNVLERERLLVEHRRHILAGPLPRGDVRELVVVAEGLAIGGLMLLAKMSTARLFAMQRVDAHQFGKL